MTQCCYVPIDDFGQFSSVRVRKARKTHTCEECREPILKGQRYNYVTGVYDGSWSDGRTCLPCAGIGRDYFPRGYMATCLREDFRQCKGFDYLTCEEDADCRNKGTK